MNVLMTAFLCAAFPAWSLFLTVSALGLRTAALWGAAAYSWIAFVAFVVGDTRSVGIALVAAALLTLAEGFSDLEAEA